MIKEKVKEQYERDGFAIIKNVISTGLANEIQNHVTWLSKKYPDTRPEAFHHNMLIHDPFIHHILDQRTILDIVEEIIGPNIALFGAHYIAKKPFSGQPVGWHQDGSYWPLEPMEVVSVWLAGTQSTKENACMKVIPGTQNKRLLKPSEMIKLDTEEYVLDLAIHPDDIDEKSSVDDIWRLLTDSKQIEFDNVMATINMEYVKKDKKPKEGDEIAFFPPVTGG